MTTTSTLEGASRVQYLGVVTGEDILGANVLKDFFAGIRDVVGGRSGTYERELQKARKIAMEEMKEAAADLGANGIIGIDLDYETINFGSSNMLMVSATGTAIKFD